MSSLFLLHKILHKAIIEPSDENTMNTNHKASTMCIPKYIKPPTHTPLPTYYLLKVLKRAMATS